MGNPLRRKELGDAEVEQLGGAIRGDQKIRRLEIAVHDQVAVGILDRRADVQHQPQTLSHRETVPVAILVDREAFHVLQHQIRKPLVRRASVVEPGDVRVLQTGENLALHQKAAQQVAGVESGADDLHRDAPFKRLVAALGEQHGAHAAPADHVQQAVRTKPAPGPGLAGVRFRKMGRRAEKRAGLLMGPEQGGDLASQLRVTGTGGVHPGLSEGRLLLEGAGKHLIDPLPDVQLHFNGSGGSAHGKATRGRAASGG